MLYHEEDKNILTIYISQFMDNSIHVEYNDILVAILQKLPFSL